MSEYIIQETTLRSIADNVRTLTGKSEQLSPSQMKSNLLLVNDEVVEQNEIINDILAILETKAAGDETALITGDIFASGYYENDRATTIRDYAFYSCSSLTSVRFPACETIGNSAFMYCSVLTTVDFPACEDIGSNAFASCKSLVSISFPACQTIRGNAFASCSSLTSVSFPACTTIGTSAFRACRYLESVSFPTCLAVSNFAFYNCSSLAHVSLPVCQNIGNNTFALCTVLSEIYLGFSDICTLANSNAFTGTLISTTGFIYVPSSLVASYQAATNWSYFSSRITGF